MNNWQFSMRILFGLIAFIAIGCAALLNANKTWAAWTFTATLLALSVATFLAFLPADNRRRVYWKSFAIVGSGYLLLVYGPALNETVEPALATTWLLDRLRPAIERPITNEKSLAPDEYSYVENNVTHYMSALPMRLYFNRVGHSLWAIVLAILGGMFAQWLHTRNIAEEVAKANSK